MHTGSWSTMEEATPGHLGTARRPPTVTVVGGELAGTTAFVLATTAPTHRVAVRLARPHEPAIASFVGGSWERKPATRRRRTMPSRPFESDSTVVAWPGDRRAGDGRRSR